MASFRSPLRFSRHFGISPAKLRRLGVFDPLLAVDTRLFIDHAALVHSAVPEVRDNGLPRVQQFFREIFKLLKNSKTPGDLWVSAAFDRWPKAEVRGTCLGYGASVRGTSIKRSLVEATLTRAAEIIKAGVDDPDLFFLVGLFQSGIGADTISDLITNLIVEDLANYTERTCTALAVPTQPFAVSGKTFKLPRNPTQQKDTPIILVPLDVLRELPVALSFSEIWDVAAANHQLRTAMNKHIASTWDKTTKEQKEEILRKLVSDPSVVRRLVQEMRNARVVPYDTAGDPKGLLLWADLAYELGATHPLKINAPAKKTLAELNLVVEAIIVQFQFLMEKRDLWKVMQLVPSRQLEKVAQTLFFATAFAYCQSNNLDITPEADTGNGPVDFKFSSGASMRILVELKLSKNDVLKGYQSQLKTYMEAEDAKAAHYVVIDLGRVGRKWDLLKAANDKDRAQNAPYTVWRIDGSARPSASKRPAKGR